MSVVEGIVKEYKDSGRLCNPNNMGKLRKTPARDERMTQRSELKDPFSSAAFISTLISDTNDINASRFTVFIKF